MRQRISLLLMLIVAGALVERAGAAPVNVDPIRPLPILDHGRVKPFDTVARESVRFITGAEFFGEVKDVQDQQDVTAKMDPVDLVLDWSAHPNLWQSRPLLYVPLLDLRAKLNMKKTEKWISARSIQENTEFTAWVKGLEEKRAAAEQSHEKIFHANAAQGRLEDAAVDLDERLQMFEGASDIRLYTIFPTQPDSDALKSLGDGWSDVVGAYKAGDDAGFASAAGQLIQTVEVLGGPQFAAATRDGSIFLFHTTAIDREVVYNSFKPFRKTWILYLISVIALIAAMMTRAKWVYFGAIGLFGVAILFHAGAFAMRCSITGWAPVTNMYETVIWVALMSAVFSFILEAVYRKRVIAIGGAVVALLATVIADVMPPEMGNAIRNLTPVLRSNYWLTIHVLTIVSSYAAFALGLVLGNIVLGQFIYGKSDPGSIRTNLLFTYRAVQIGVLLVAAGTILGGLWADMSWGRFWGWDPKEVWALIVLLTYLALLHGRFAGWIKQFGMAAGAVICFTAVIMSWYGVNFVLGAGLHAYGFNTGGQEYVAGFVLVQWAYVAFAWFVYKKRQDGKNSRRSADAPDDAFPMGTAIVGK